MTKHVYLKPGEYYVSRSQTVISTVLGSCVSACLFDPVNHVMGMNHFLLSGEHPPPNGPLIYTDMGRYGVHSMELLINRLLKYGAERKYIKAKVFGGARLLLSSTPKNTFLNVGEVNSRFVRNFLIREQIPILAADLEGNQGRVVRFYSQNFDVYVKKINRIENKKLIQKEKTYWHHTRKKQKHHVDNVDLWD